MRLRMSQDTQVTIEPLSVTDIRNFTNDMSSKLLVICLLSFFHLFTPKFKQFGYLVKLVTGHFNTIINTRTSFFARAQMCPSLPREVVSPEKKLKVSSAFRVRVPLANNS